MSGNTKVSQSTFDFRSRLAIACFALSLFLYAYIQWIPSLAIVHSPENAIFTFKLANNISNMLMMFLIAFTRLSPERTRSTAYTTSLVFFLVSGCLLLGAFSINQSELVLFFSGFLFGGGMALLFIFWISFLTLCNGSSIKGIVLWASTLSMIAQAAYFFLPSEIRLGVIALAIVALGVGVIVASKTPAPTMRRSRERSVHNVSFKTTLLSLIIPILSAFGIGLIAPVISAVTFSTPLGSFLLLGLHSIGTLIAVGVLYLLWFRTSKTPSIQQIFSVIMPMLSGLLLLIPFLGEMYRHFVYVSSSGAYVLSSILIIVFCVETALHSGTSITVLYGFCGGSVYLSRTMGEYLGETIKTSSVQSEVQILASVFLLIYSLLFISFLIYKQTQSKSDRHEKPSSDNAEIPLPELVERVKEHYSLSARESEILSLLLDGRNVPYIAEFLYLSKNTVETHVKSIYRRLDVHSRQEMIDVVKLIR